MQYFTEALELSDGWVQNVDYDMNYYLAAAYRKNGQPAEAKKVYDAILGLKPEEKDAYFLRGSAELELGDYESAKADFDKAISMDPKNYDRLIEIYEALADYGYREVGQEYLQNVLNTDKKLDAYDSGRIYYYLGDYQKAYLALEEAKGKGGVCLLYTSTPPFSFSRKVKWISAANSTKLCSPRDMWQSSQYRMKIH